MWSIWNLDCCVVEKSRKREREKKCDFSSFAVVVKRWMAEENEENVHVNCQNLNCQCWWTEEKKQQRLTDHLDKWARFTWFFIKHDYRKSKILRFFLFRSTASDGFCFVVPCKFFVCLTLQQIRWEKNRWFFLRVRVALCWRFFWCILPIIVSWIVVHYNYSCSQKFNAKSEWMPLKPNWFHLYVITIVTAAPAFNAIVPMIFSILAFCDNEPRWTALN